MKLSKFRPQQVEQRNPLVTPLLTAALDRLTPSRRARQVNILLRAGRVADAVALAEQILADADHI